MSAGSFNKSLVVLKFLGCQAAGKAKESQAEGLLLSRVPFIFPVCPSCSALTVEWTLGFYISTMVLGPWVCGLRFFEFSPVSSHCSSQAQEKLHQLPVKQLLLLRLYRHEASSNPSQVATGKTNCGKFLGMRRCLSLCVVSILFLTARLCSHE